MSVDAVAAWERGRLARLRAGGARTQGISGGRARLTRLRAGDARTQVVIAARPQSRATEMNVGRRCRRAGQEHSDHCEVQAGVTWTCDRHPSIVRFPLVRD